MNNSPPRGSPLRSAGAILAGIVVIFITSMGTDAALHASGVYPPWMQPMDTHLWIVALAYRIPYGILAAWVTAVIGRARPMWHAMLFGWIGVVLSTIGVAMHWNKGPEFGPVWFNLGLVAISLPCAWIGGLLRQRQLQAQPA
ncbi:MAG: hypothetical protein ACREJO_07210 [Phycisphaerales bacterium]